MPASNACCYLLQMRKASPSWLFIIALGRWIVHVLDHQVVLKIQSYFQFIGLDLEFGSLAGTKYKLPAVYLSSRKEDFTDTRSRMECYTLAYIISIIKSGNSWSNTHIKHFFTNFDGTRTSLPWTRYPGGKQYCKFHSSIYPLSFMGV